MYSNRPALYSLLHCDLPFTETNQNSLILMVNTRIRRKHFNHFSSSQSTWIISCYLPLRLDKLRTKNLIPCFIAGKCFRFADGKSSGPDSGIEAGDVGEEFGKLGCGDEVRWKGSRESSEPVEGPNS